MSVYFTTPRPNRGSLPGAPLSSVNFASNARHSSAVRYNAPPWRIINSYKSVLLTLFQHKLDWLIFFIDRIVYKIRDEVVSIFQIRCHQCLQFFPTEISIWPILEALPLSLFGTITFWLEFIISWKLLFCAMPLTFKSLMSVYIYSCIEDLRPLPTGPFLSSDLFW